MSRIASDLASSSHHPFAVESQTGNPNFKMQRLCLGKLPRVAVVGAGISGLRCADILGRAGIEVTIFEARNRIGGRINQVETGGYLVDTGSNWIHGTVGNPISKIAKQTGTVIMEPEERSVVIDFEGKMRTEEESSELSADFWEAIVESFRYSDEHSPTIDVNTSLLDHLTERWSAKYPGKREKLRDLDNECRMWGQFVGSTIERQSLKFFFLEETLEGENVFVASTYQKILQEVSKPVLAKAELRLGHEVKEIRYRQSDSDGEVKIKLTDGTEHSFDEVVVTCPLGWLKRNKKTCFVPQLPPRLSNAIDNIGYGALEKLYITFPKAFWLGAQLPSTYSFQTQNHPCFTHFHNPTYHPDPVSKSSTTWNQSVVSLAHLPQPATQPTLLFYMYGDCGVHLTHQVRAHESHSELYNRILHSFAKPFYSRLPEFDPVSDACKPTSFYLTSWQTDPFAGYGSYSCFRTGLAEGDKDIEIMRNAGGLGDEGKGLWLAGEHTAPFVALGTTTGAYWSGEGVARRIAKQYGLQIIEEGVDGTPTDVENPSGRASGEASEMNVGKSGHGVPSSKI